MIIDASLSGSLFGNSKNLNMGYWGIRVMGWGNGIVIVIIRVGCIDQETRVWN